jgi:hypothetical protein
MPNHVWFIHPEYQKRRLVVAMEALQNSIFSTQIHNILGVQLFSNTPGTASIKTLSQHANFAGIESVEITYTTPRLFKWKTIDFVSRGSTKAIWHL